MENSHLPSWLPFVAAMKEYFRLRRRHLTAFWDLQFLMGTDPPQQGCSMSPEVRALGRSGMSPHALSPSLKIKQIDHTRD